MTIINRYKGIDVLPWFAEVSETAIPVGTRLFNFRSYHEAPDGTVTRLGRKNGVGQVLIKQGGVWRPDGSNAHPALTSYGMENRASYVEKANKREVRNRSGYRRHNRRGNCAGHCSLCRGNPGFRNHGNDNTGGKPK